MRVERVLAKQTPVKNEAGETGERVINMMNGKDDVGG